MIRNLNRWLIIAIIIILASGILLTLWNIQREENFLREDLLTKTRLVQECINPGHVKALSGTEADLISPDYQTLKGQLGLLPTRGGLSGSICNPGEYIYFR
jgi:hypothetical protein